MSERFSHGVVAQASALGQTVYGEGDEGGILFHELGNSLVAVAFGLEGLRGCQRTEQLEKLVEKIREAAEQGIGVTRTLALKAASADEAKGVEPRKIDSD